MKQIHYRHEFKYSMTHGQIFMEEARINNVMSKDAHATSKGYYNIRSLYFDDYENSCYMDNENGVDNREKYRIRIYNCNTEHIQLELKQKLRGKTGKRSCTISRSQCQMLMEGKIPSNIEPNQQVLHKLSYLMAVRLMRPVIIVDYDRVPYVYRPGDANVRITFDRNITSVNNIYSFMDNHIQGRGVMPKGQALMEVKFDDFLPDEVRSLLQLDELSASTFSKYYLCRKFTLH